MRLSIKDPKNVSFILCETIHYPRLPSFRLDACYNIVTLDIDSKSESYDGGFYVLYSRGYISFKKPSGENVDIAASITDCWNVGGRPLTLRIDSEPLSRSMIHEIDEKLRPDDLEVRWSIDVYGFLEEDSAKRYNAGLIPIFVGTDSPHKISRIEFVRNVLEKADMLRREFIEVVIEPIDLSYVIDSRAKSALQLLFEKQKLLLGAKNKLAEAKTSTDFRGIIDEVRRVVEGLYQLEEICGEMYKKLGYIESSDVEAIDETSKEMADAVVSKNSLTAATFYFASRFGIHAETRTKRLYTPTPTRMEAEFAVQQALIELNYLVKLLSTFSMRT